MKIEELATAGLTAVVSQGEQEGRDVHAMLLLVDVVTGDTSLQALASQNGPGLCCCLSLLFRKFVAANPELAASVAEQITAALSAPAAEMVH